MRLCLFVRTQTGSVFVLNQQLITINIFHSNRVYEDLNFKREIAVAELDYMKGKL